MPATIETIDIDPTTRLVVFVDDDAEDPRTWGNYTEEDGPTMEAWRNGDVFGVEIQKLETWQNMADPTVTRQEWEPQGSLGGCYLDDNYTARTVAAEYFGIPEQV